MKYSTKHGTDTRCHYKMYKVGKIWVFAGITVATLSWGILDQVKVQADTQDATNSEVKEVTESSNGGNIYVLRRGASSSAAISESSAATTSETSSSASSATTSVNSGTSQSSVVKQDSSKQRTGYALKPTKADSSASNNDTQQQTNLNVEGSIDQVGETKTPTNLNQDPSGDVLRDQTFNIDKEVDPELTKKQANKEKYEKTGRRNIGSGTDGTCEWVITGDGILEIGPGTLGKGMYPWIDYGNDIKKIDFTGPVVFPAYSSNLFDNLTEVTSIEHLENVNTSNVTDMSYMFSACSSLTSLDLTSFDTSNVTNMSFMFVSCSSLTSLDVTNFDTSNVTDMSSMFSNCSSLTSLDVTNFDTANVTDMSDMFVSCSSLTSLDVTNFDTSNVTDMSFMFYSCSSLTSLDVTNFDTSNVTNMSFMFYECSMLKSLNVANFDISNVTDMGDMFYGCSSLTSLDVTNFDTSNVTDMHFMFYECSMLESLDLTNFDTSNVTDMGGMFYECSMLESLNVANFDTSNVTDMSSMLTYCIDLRIIVLGAHSIFDTSVDLPEQFSLGTTNRWQAVADGTIRNPQGDALYTSHELMMDYDGSKPDTYVIAALRTAIDGHDSTIVAGPDQTWTASDNFISATDAKGHAVDVADVKVDGMTNPQVPGTYDITYSYKDELGNQVSKTVTVTIVASQVSVDGHDSTMIAGPTQTWTAIDNFDGATDANGNPLTVEDVKVTGTVNPKKPGTYDITYSYTDEVGNQVSKTVTVTVVASQSSVDAHDSTVMASPNQTWTANDNFNGATDAEGNPLGIEDVKVTGTVNPQVPGTYDITYSYTDEVGNEVSQTVTVTVKAGAASATVTYVDSDGNVVETKTVDGTDGANADYTIDVPAGYEIDESQTSYQDGDTITLTLTRYDDTDNVVIHLKHGQDIVDPGDHEDPNDPLYAETHWTVNQTVHYKNQNGNPILDDQNYVLNYERTLVKDAVTDEVISYGPWTLVGGNGLGRALGDDSTFAAHDVPAVDGYYALPSEVPVQSFEIPTSGAGNPGHTQDQEFTVYYYQNEVVVNPTDPKDPNTPINPEDPNSPGYPTGVSENDLNQSVTETIHYRDAVTGAELADTYTVTVNYSRTAKIYSNTDGTVDHVEYGTWQADGEFNDVKSPVVDGYIANQTVITAPTVTDPTQANVEVTVLYYANEVIVTPDDPKDPDTPVNPKDPNSPDYPDGVTETDLNKDVTETIHYVDQDGNVLAESYTQTVHYTRNAQVHFNADDTATVTYDAWVAEGNFEAVNSPVIDGYVADQPTVAAVDGNTVTDNFEITVQYHREAVVVEDDQDEEVTPEIQESTAPKETRAQRYGHVVAKKLPQTGDQHSSTASELGALGLIAGSLGLFGLAKKRKHDA